MSIFENLDEVYEVDLLQRLMLESLILPAPECKRSFSRWLETVDLGALDIGSLRLVPALFDRFGTTISTIPCHAAMKGVYRQFQCRNSLTMSGGRKVLARMLDAGIDAVLFKGIALTLKYYRNLAIRPMGDMDVLVRRESIPRAEAVLRECGYQYVHPGERKGTDVHSHDYGQDDIRGFDLHWYSLYESIKPGIDDGIWERTEFLDWDGLVVKVMSPEDLLLTSIVNGVRDSPMRAHWIHDVATILSSEPAILWDVVWKEARKRGLREQVFNALRLVGSISVEAVPNTLLQYFLDSDPEFHRNVLRAAIAEGWADGLPSPQLHEIESILASVEARQPPPDSGAASSHPGAPGAPRHIRYSRDENGAINALFLQWRHLPLVAELFEISDRQKLEELESKHTSHGRGRVDVPAGVLNAKTEHQLPAYKAAARISVMDGTDNLVLSPLEVTEIRVEVANDSPFCWAIAAGSAAQFGVSYHLLAEDGATLVWDWPRTYFLSARGGSVGFIEPSQVLTCNLRIVAPGTPGRYVVQLDLVHEHVQWFYAHDNVFARLDLQVIGNDDGGRYAISGPGIVYETIDDETAIIDTARAAYYTVSGYGSLIWSAIAAGHGPDEIISAFAAADVSGVDRNVVRQFIDSLLSEGLIASSKATENRARAELSVNGSVGTRPPVLTRHAALRELMARHPVRDASERSGWPHPLEANGPLVDVKDVRG